MQDIRQDDREKWFLGSTATELNAFLDRFASEYIIRYPARVFSFSDADLEIPSVNMKGSGKPRNAYSPTTGTVLKMGSGKRVIADANATLRLEDLGIWIYGDYSANADAPIDFFDDNTIVADRCAFYLNMTLANGHATAPETNKGGIAMLTGKSAGPNGVPSSFKDCLFCDHRQGSPTNTYMLGFKHEQFLMENCFGYERFVDTLVTPRRFYANPVTSAMFRGNTIFTDAGITGQYDVEYLIVGTNKNLRFENNQFIPAARITTAHFGTAGSAFIDGINPYQAEGGYTPILLSTSGTVTQLWKGRGYESSGSSAIISGQTHVHVTHGLVTTPAKVRITPTAKSTADPTYYIWVDTIGATEFVVNCAVDPGVLTLPFLWEAEV